MKFSIGKVAERVDCEQESNQREAKASPADPRHSFLIEALPRNYGRVAERLKAAGC